MPGCTDTLPVETGGSIVAESGAEGNNAAEKTLDELLSSGTVVEVPAGSVDALADAIASAGSGGVVLLKSGLHHESGTVEINHTVTLVGETGATLISDTTPEFTTGIMDPALLIYGAPDVVVRDFKIIPKGDVGGTALWVEDSPNMVMSHMTILEHERGVIIQHSDHVSIRHNKIVSSTRWQTGDLGFTEGVLVVNGNFAIIEHNDVSDALVGIFVSDRKGLIANNNTHGNLIGIVLCNHPVTLATPGGDLVGSEVNATLWMVRDNYSHDNLDTGYLVVDGANKNYLVNNRGGNNAKYDIELAGDSNRFGFFTPTSRETIVNTQKYNDMVVKDCGVDDKITGGQLVDLSIDPCY